MDTKISNDLELEVLVKLQRARSAAQILLDELWTECKGTGRLAQIHDALQCTEDARYDAEKALEAIIEGSETE
jgi:hypothetical protein